MTYTATFDEYGIWLHDGGSSCVPLAYCPWCGARPPESRRKMWFDTVERTGFDEPSEQQIPPEFQSDA